MALLSPTMRLAITVNAEREHFAEAYEGFNDCTAWVMGYPTGVCNCGKAEAEAAMAEIKALQEVEHVRQPLGPN